jgi:hypothetical protein
VLDVAAFEHGIEADVAIQREFLAVFLADGAVGAADEEVGLDAAEARSALDALLARAIRYDVHVFDPLVSRKLERLTASPAQDFVSSLATRLTDVIDDDDVVDDQYGLYQHHHHHHPLDNYP